MAKGGRQAANDLKPERLPELHCALIRAHDEVELHGSIALGPRVYQRVLTHATSDPSAGGRGARHVATVTDMPSAAGLVRTHVVGAKDDALLLGDECLFIRGYPVGQCLGFAQVRVERVRGTLANDREDDGSDRAGIPRFGLPDIEHPLILSREQAANQLPVTAHRPRQPPKACAVLASLWFRLAARRTHLRP